MKKLTNTDGITVKELKELIKDWPEKRENGDDTYILFSIEPFKLIKFKYIWQPKLGDMVFKP